MDAAGEAILLNTVMSMYQPMFIRCDQPPENEKRDSSEAARLARQMSAEKGVGHIVVRYTGAFPNEVGGENVVYEATIMNLAVTRDSTKKSVRMVGT